MGWIANRAFRTGSALYEGGPKKRGPLRKVLNTIAGDYSTNLFGSDIVLLECGHTTRAYGGKRAICEKCRLGQPIDDLANWGLENPVKSFTSERECDCFAQEGKDAHAEGTERSECPYGEDTDGRAGWLRGWDLAAQNVL